MKNFSGNLLVAAVAAILFSFSVSAPAHHGAVRNQRCDQLNKPCPVESSRFAMKNGNGCCDPPARMATMDRVQAANDSAQAIVLPTPYPYPSIVPTLPPNTTGCNGKPTFPVKFKEPLLPNIYTADPSAHVFNGKLYVICSTDDPKENLPNPNETLFLMTRYTVMSFNEDLSQVTDEGEVLPLSTVPWAAKQMWAPDFTCQGSKCFLYFPAMAKDEKFRIGAAISITGPTGPYKAEKNYIQGTYSVDPAVFVDDDNCGWLVWGGEWGGQLEDWQTGHWNPNATRPTSGPALTPRIAKLKPNMVEIEAVQKLSIVDSCGTPIQADDNDRKFFEASWIHKANSKYYLTYSTGETHFLVYATSDKVTGPYTFQGELMSPPIGWTTHESIVKYRNRTYLFYHDSKTSGQTNLRQVKFQPLEYEADGRIKQVSP